MSSKGNWLKLAVHILFIVLVVILVGLFMSISSDAYRLDTHIQPLNEGWTVTYGDTVIEDATLPMELDVPPGTPYTITQDAVYAQKSASTLRIRASMMSITVRIGGDIIFSEDITEQDSWFHDPYASVWHFIHIPEERYGQPLSITFISPLSEFSGTLNAVYYGAGVSLLTAAIRERIVDFFIALFLIMAGFVFIFTTPLTNRLNGDARILYLGEFAIIIGFWLLSETRFLQIFTGNRFLIGSLGYLCVALIPIPLMLYIRGIVQKRLRKVFTILAIGFAILFLHIIYLQVTGKAFYIEITQFSLIFLVAAAIFIIGVLIYETIRHANQAAKRFLRHFIVLFVFASLEIIFFFLRLYDFQSNFISIGIMIFYLLLAYDSVGYINDLLVKKNESAFFERLAYRDHLTGGANRTAFERDLEAYLGKEHTASFRLVLFDLNELKKLNDTYGHVVGDQALTAVFEALEASFGTYGRCYRISGDEFAALVENTSDEVFTESSAMLKQELLLRSAGLPQLLEVALGSDVYSKAHEMSFDEFYHTVDQRMYENKRSMKQKS